MMMMLINSRIYSIFTTHMLSKVLSICLDNNAFACQASSVCLARPELTKYFTSQAIYHTFVAYLKPLLQKGLS